MTVYDYTIGFNYDSDNNSVTVYVNEADTKNRVHDVTFSNVDNQLQAFLHYCEYCDYLTDLGEYWFLDAIGVLGLTDNSYVLPVPEKRNNIHF